METIQIIGIVCSAIGIICGSIGFGFAYLDYKEVKRIEKAKNSAEIFVFPTETTRKNHNEL